MSLNTSMSYLDSPSVQKLSNFFTKHKLSSLFVIISLIFGIYFVFAIPIFWGADETSHVARVYQISKGDLHAHKQKHDRVEGGYGGLIPENLYASILNVNHDQMNNKSSGNPVIGVRNVDDPLIYKDLGGRKLENGKYVTWGFPNTSAYSPVSYIPSIIGMKIANVLDVNIYKMLIIMRLCNLLFFIVIIYGALRILETTNLKWVFFTIALIPMSLFEGSFVTADTLTIAFVFLFSAIILKALFYGKKQQLSAFELCLLVLSAIVIPLLKPGYFPFVGALLLIPAYAIPIKKSYINIGKAIVIIISALLFLLWTFSTRDVTNSAALIRPGDGWELVSSSEQLHHILTNPVHYIIVLIRSLILEDTKYINELLGGLGFNFVQLPGAAIIAIVTSVMLALGIMEKIHVAWYRILGIFCTAIFAIGIIFTGMYLTFSNVDAPVVGGVQGRYFLPVLPFLFGSLIPLIKKRINPDFFTPSKYAIVIMVVFALIVTTIKYTYVTWG